MQPTVRTRFQRARSLKLHLQYPTDMMTKNMNGLEVLLLGI